MIEVSDEMALPIMMLRMKGVTMLPEGVTLQDDFRAYLSAEHYNYFSDDLTSFLGISVHDTYVSVSYAYRGGDFSTHKEMVQFAKKLYKRYTIGQEKPILYSGLKNFYPNHSIELAPGILWQFKPKD